MVYSLTVLRNATQIRVMMIVGSVSTFLLPERLGQAEQTAVSGRFSATFSRDCLKCPRLASAVGTQHRSANWNPWVTDSLHQYCQRVSKQL